MVRFDSDATSGKFKIAGKKTKRKPRNTKPTGSGGLFNFARDSYFERTSRPVYALMFLVPFIAVYEIGTLWINTDVLKQTQQRVVAFVWLQNFLEYLGTGARIAWVAPPLVVVVILLAWQIASRKSWYFSPYDILPMVIESILLAIPLIVLSLFLNSSMRPPANGYAGAADFLDRCVTACAATLGNGSLAADIVTGIGAGIYEELVFRLILICLLMLVFQDIIKMPYKSSLVLSVLLSAALFSLHHHIIFVNGQLSWGDAFDTVKLLFRTLAGIYFAVLYAMRGFGITAGTHAFYDIIATILNAAFFSD